MAPKSQLLQRRSESEEPGSSSPSEALRRRYNWVAQEVLATTSLMSEADVARMKLPAMEGCVCAPAGAGEPVCAGREEGEPSFFYFYREVNTRVKITFPFSAFQMSALTYLRLAPSQLHPNGWAYLLAFERLCGSFPVPIPCTANLFFHYFCPFTPGSSREGDNLKGLVSLRNVSDRKLMGAFSDSFKRFKSAFYKVVAVIGQRPWFLDGAEGPDAEGRFPLYWGQGHYQTSPTSYLVDEGRLLPDTKPHVSRLAAFVEKYGIQSAASFISGDASEPLTPSCRS